MKKSENTLYIVLSVILIFAIIAIIVFVIVPRYSQESTDNVVDEIDFSNSEWLEQYVENNGGIFGKDFFLKTAFSYNIRSNKIIATYASQNSIEEAREYYLALPGAEQTGRNDETSLDITAENNGQRLRVYNYFSAVSRVFELDLTPETGKAEQIKSQLKEAFPADELAKISEIDDLAAGEVFGGYVRYQYDNLDEFAYPNLPIFSQAYVYDGTEDDYDKVIEGMREAYPDNKYDETQDAHHFKINGQIVSVALFATDENENIVSISIQNEKDEG